MKKIVFRLMLLLTITSISFKAFSQFEHGFAGEDKSVLFDPGSDDHIKVDLGKFDSRDNVYYSWELLDSPIGGTVHYVNGDQFRCDVTVEIDAPGEYIFRCNQISNYGYQSETVVVRVLSDIKLIKAEKKVKQCFKEDEIVSAADYDFTTDPPGYGEMVKVHPDDEVIKGSFYDWPLVLHKVRFQVRDLNGVYNDSEVTDQCVVLDPARTYSYGKIKPYLPSNSGEGGGGKKTYEKLLDIPLEVKVSMDVDLCKVIGAMDRLDCVTNPDRYVPDFIINPSITINNEDVVIAAKGVSTIPIARAVFRYIRVMHKFLKLDNVLEGIPHKGVGFYFRFDKKIDDFGIRFDCCGNKPVPQILFDGTFGVSIGMNLDVPIYKPPLPFIGGLYATGIIAFRLEMDPTFKEPILSDCGSVKFPMKFGMENGIGLKAVLIDESYLSAQITISSIFMLKTWINIGSMLDENFEYCWQCNDNWYEIGEGTNISLWIHAKYNALTFKKDIFKYKLIEVNSIEGLISTTESY